MDALRGAVAALPTRMVLPVDAAALDGSWERFGIPGDALARVLDRTGRASPLRRD